MEHEALEANIKYMLIIQWVASERGWVDDSYRHGCMTVLKEATSANVYAS